MRELVIHGGVHRTGTTSLQSFLSNNRAALETAGYAYPGDEKNHQRWAWDLHTGRSTPDDLRAALSDVEINTIIMSAEDFCIHRNTAWIEALKADFDRIEVHFVLRRQDDWIMSWYNQHVRWPFEQRKSTMTPMEFLGTIDDYYWLDYHWLGMTWAERIGRENVHMYPLDGDTVGLLTQKLCPTAELDMTADRTNEATAPEVIEIIRHLNAHHMRPGQRSKVIKALASAYDGKPKNRSIYPPAVLDMIMSKYSASNRAAFSEFVRSEAADFEARRKNDADFFQPTLPDPETLLREYIGPMLSAL